MLLHKNCVRGNVDAHGFCSRNKEEAQLLFADQSRRALGGWGESQGLLKLAFVNLRSPWLGKDMNDCSRAELCPLSSWLKNKASMFHWCLPSPF